MKTFQEIIVEELTVRQLADLEQAVETGKKWGFPPDRARCDHGHFLFEFSGIEHLIYKPSHQNYPVIDIILGYSPNRQWGVSSSLRLTNNGWGGPLSVYGSSYPNREDALQAEITILKNEIKKHYPQDKLAAPALNWLKKEEENLIQPDLFRKLF